MSPRQLSLDYRIDAFSEVGTLVDYRTEILDSYLKSMITVSDIAPLGESRGRETGFQ